MSAIWAVILAAGAGRRLGTVAKALLTDAHGRTFLQAVCETGAAAGVTRWVVVVGPPHDQATRDHALRLGADLGLDIAVVRNPDPGRGMASSVELGFAQLVDHATACRAALLWPVDHPAVRVDTVRAVIEQSHEHGAVIPMAGPRGGHPSSMGRALWPRLAVCATAPQGARSVIRELEAGPGRESRVVRFEAGDPGVIADVDTPADLAHAAGLAPGTKTGQNPGALPDTAE